MHNGNGTRVLHEPFDRHALRAARMQAKELHLDYKAIQHHVRVLEKNNLISKVGEKYGVTYFVSTFLEVNMETFEEIVEKLDKSK